MLLRKAVLRDAAPPAEGQLWELMDGPAQEHCRAGLLALFQSEPSSDVQHRLGDAIAEVARLQSRWGEWPELLAVLMSCRQPASRPQSLVLSLLRVLGAVPEVVENYLGAPEGVEAVVSLIQACLQQPSAEIRLEALRALSSLTYVLGDEDENPDRARVIESAFCSTVSAGSEIIRSLGDEPELQAEAILTLIDLLTTNSRMFKTAWGPLSSLLLQLVASQETDEDVRKGGLELLLTLLECVKKARKDNGLLRAVLELLLRLTGEVEADESEWLKRTPDEDDLCEPEMLSGLAEQALDRLAMELHGRALMPHLQQLLPACLGNTADWRARYAGLRALASVAEGCMDVLADAPLEATLGLIWRSFTDSHARVQHAACHALGQLCTDFDGSIQAGHGDEALQALVSLLSASPHARVQAHAAAALINFAEGVEPAALAPHLDSLLGRVVGLLAAPQPAAVYLRAQLLATLGSFASAAGPAFQRYYPAVVPALLAQVRAAGTDYEDREERQVQCRALEALSIIFFSLGREGLQPADLDALVQHMMRLQQANLPEDDPMSEYLSVSWARLCRIVGADMAPLLPLLIPPLLSRAGQSPDLASLALDASLEEYDMTEWQFATVRGRRLGIRTATLDAKLEAMQDLLGYVEALQAAYLPMAAETARVALAGLAFALHEGVQAAAAELLAALLPIMASAEGNSVMGELVQKTTQALLAACDPDNYTAEFACAALDALADLTGLLTAALGPALPAAALPALHGLLTVLEPIEADGADSEDEDDEDDLDAFSAEIEEQEEVLYSLSRFMAQLLRAHHATIDAALLDPLAAYCIQVACNRSASANLRHAAICVLDDLLHWSGCAARWAAEVSKALAAGIAERDDPDLRQAALFGVGMAAEHGGPAFLPFLQSVLPQAILPLLRAPNARAPSQAAVTDNAVSAAGRILLAHPQLASAALLESWLGAFPVVTDADEILPAYRALRHLVQAGTVPPTGMAQRIQPALALSADPFAADPALRADLTALAQH